MKKHNIVFLVTTILLILTATGCSSHHIKKDKLSEKAAVSKYRNVIVMVPDGCSMSIETFARLYKGSDIHLDKLHTGSVRTYSANSIITDSAAAATAFATGHKTTTGFLGIAPSTEDLLPFFKPDATPYYPLPTLLEGAKFNGKSTGLVVTSVTGHATPGGFAAHASSRNMSDDITEQMVYQDIDVVFSGGGCNLLPVGVQYRSASGDIWNGKRKDTENLITSLLERGYEFISSRAELEELGNKKAWGVFNEKNLVPDIDRDELNPSQPSLAEMTRKAIEILSNNEKGFFLMVEGSQVDYAGHDNDPVYMVTEFLAFDEAVGVAIEYAQKNDDTLVVIFPDHDTGGLSIGNNSEAGRKYSSTSLETLTGPFKNAQMTVAGLLELAYKENDVTTEKIKKLFNTKWGLSLSDNQAEEILNFNNNPYNVSSYISNTFSIIGWTTKGHTGVDVPLWVYPADCSHTFRGNIDNTDIAVKLANIMDFDLGIMNKELFVDAATVFPDYKLLNDATGYILETGVTRLPINKDIIYKDDKVLRTQGIVVYIPEINKIFIPMEAVKIIQDNQE